MTQVALARDNFMKMYGNFGLMFARPNMRMMTSMNTYVEETSSGDSVRIELSQERLFDFGTLAGCPFPRRLGLDLP